MNQPLEHYFAPIGKVVLLFNQLETTLVMFAGGLCLPEINAVTALMSEASFSRKLDALKCIADEKLRDPALHLKFVELLKQLQAAEDIRNRISHTLYLGSPQSEMWKLKWSGKRKTGNSAVLHFASPKEIEEAGEQVYAAFSSLCEFTRTLQEQGILKIQLVKASTSQ